jgi:release factor glutamine methyltransferase
VATDLSGAALDVARANAARHAVADRIEFREGAYLAGASGPFDLIVSNPPYITESDYASLAPEVRSFEPALALASGPDGLRDIREILVLAGTALAPGGVLLMEIGYGQDAALHGLVAAVPSLRLLRIRNDLQGIPRTVVATRR